MCPCVCVCVREIGGEGVAHIQHELWKEVRVWMKVRADVWITSLEYRRIQVWPLSAPRNGDISQTVPRFGFSRNSQMLAPRSNERDLRHIRAICAGVLSILPSASVQPRVHRRTVNATGRYYTSLCANLPELINPRISHFYFSVKQLKALDSPNDEPFPVQRILPESKC